jgi:hypothetical protein
MAYNTLKYYRIDPELRNQKRHAWNTPVVWPIITGIILLIIVLLPAWISYRRKEQHRILHTG